MHLRFLGLLAIVVAPAALAASPLEEAVALYSKSDFAGAAAKLRLAVAAEPQNARAWYYLGLATFYLGGPDALERTLPPLEKAARLAPQDPEILEKYGVVAIQYAARHNAVFVARRGRDALESCVQIDPNNVTARETLYDFYTQAPWPFSSRSKAAAHLEGIRQRDSLRAQLLLINARMRAKAYAEVFPLCEAALAQHPQDSVVMIQYGFAAVLSGQNSEQGLKYLQAVVARDPYPANAPPLTNAWHWIGNLQERLGHRDAARAAYEHALSLDRTNKWAQEGLARVK